MNNEPIKVSQKQSKVVGSLATSINAKNKEVSEIGKQLNTLESLSDTFANSAVKQLKKDAEKKAMIDAGEGKLDMNSTQFTVYGQAYAKKANAIDKTNFNIKLADAEATARVDNEYDLEGYTAQMEDFYTVNTQDIPDKLRIERQQDYEQRFLTGQRAVIKNKTDKINREYLGSLKAGMDETRKQLLQTADSGDKAGYEKAQADYVTQVTQLLEDELITPEKAVTLIKNQYDEGTEEFIMSDFDAVLDTSTEGAVKFANEFKDAKDKDFYKDGDRLYDVPQRDAMHAKMLARIKAETNVDKTTRARTRKYNNTVVEDAIEVLKGGGDPANMTEALSFSAEEISPSLYAELRAEQAQLPQRVAFAQATSQEQYDIIKHLENERRAGVKQTVYEKRLLEGHKQEFEKKVGLIQSDPSLVREEQLSGNMIKYDGTNMTEYLQLSQESVNSFADEEGGKRWYFTNADAKVITDQYNAMDYKGKLDFINEISTALGDEARFVFEQLGQTSLQVVTLNQTGKLDATGETSMNILKGSDMIKEDKTLLPKKVDETYNQLDKTSSSEYTTKVKGQIKQDVLALAVALNGGGDADNITEDALQTAYDMIVGKEVSSGWFGHGRSVTAPWQGATYSDFELAVDKIQVEDLPEFVNQTPETIQMLMGEDNSNLVYKNAGVGDYHLYYRGTLIQQFVGEPIEYTDEKGKVKTRRRTAPYVMKIRMP